MRLIKIIFTAAVALAATIASAQGLKVTAELDSTVMTQGYCTDLRVRVLGTADAHTVDWPKEGGQLAGVDVAKISADTADLGNGRRETTYTLTLQPFDPDTVTLPPLRVACGTDTAETRALVLKVLPVELDSLTTIHPMEGPVAYPAKWYDWVPQWVSDYWPWIIIAIGLIAAAVAAWIYFRRGGTVMVRRKRIVPPYELAMHRLGQLRERRLAESGHEKEYYTELTDILRQYLEGRFGINAMEMTSTEIVRSLRANETTRMSADRMRSVLEVADFVKFAKMRPLPDDNVKSYNAAVAFVEDTRPAPDPDTENGENKTEKAK